MTFDKNLCATAIKASLGHEVNQSIVQQLIRAGNFLNLSLNASPIGENANTICRFCFTRRIKNEYNSCICISPAALPNTCLANGLTPSHIAALSSDGNIFGTSPLFNILLISSTNVSFLI